MRIFTHIHLPIYCDMLLGLTGHGIIFSSVLTNITSVLSQHSLQKGLQLSAWPLLLLAWMAFDGDPILVGTQRYYTCQMPHAH